MNANGSCHGLPGSSPEPESSTQMPPQPQLQLSRTLSPEQPTFIRALASRDQTLSQTTSQTPAKIAAAISPYVSPYAQHGSWIRSKGGVPAYVKKINYPKNRASAGTHQPKKPRAKTKAHVPSNPAPNDPAQSSLVQQGPAQPSGTYGVYNLESPQRTTHWGPEATRKTIEQVPIGTPEPTEATQFVRDLDCPPRNRHSSEYRDNLHGRAPQDRPDNSRRVLRPRPRDIRKWVPVSATESGQTQDSQTPFQDHGASFRDDRAPFKYTEDSYHNQVMRQAREEPPPETALETYGVESDPRAAMRIWPSRFGCV